MQTESTPGRNRAVHWASSLAQQANEAAWQAGHLLWGLYLSETRATQFLARYDIDLELLLSAEEFVGFPLPDSLVNDKQGDNIEQNRVNLPDFSTNENRVGTEVPPDATAELILKESKTQHQIHSTEPDESSEHLLLALTIVESPVATFLNRVDCTYERLAQDLKAADGFDDSPIDATIRLDLQEPTESEQADYFRVIDAAANRAREGLRVLEDYTRFVVNDAVLTGQLKQIRHDFADALKSFLPEDLLKARNTQGDVGTSISTHQEQHRETDLDLIQANCKRLQEAFRTLEEFTKLVSPYTSPKIEQLRYRFYTIESNLFSTLNNQRDLANCQLYLLASENLCHHGIGPAVRNSLSAGVSVVQLREKNLADRELLKLARLLRKWTDETGAKLIINDRPDIAVLCNADGVHVGQDELSVRDARRIIGARRLVGVSTHNIEQARRAVGDGADYLGVGPVFPSTTKSFEAFAGLEFVRQVANEITLPWYAIGGINASNLARVMAAGAKRVAVSGAICGAENPDIVAGELVSQLQTAQ